MSGLGLWFYDFIRELSHNKNVVEALEITVQEGNFFFSNKVLRETTLEHVVLSIIEKLRQPTFSEIAFEIQTRLSPQRIFIAAELANLLEQNKEIFTYLKESGDASGIAEISTPVFEKCDDTFLDEERRYELDKIIFYRRKNDGTRLGGGMLGGLLGSSGGGGGGYRSSGEEQHSINTNDFDNISNASEEDADTQNSSDKESGGNREYLDKGIKNKYSSPLDIVVSGDIAGINKNVITEDEPRYLQAQVKTKNNAIKNLSLTPATAYLMEVRIGLEDSNFISSLDKIDSTQIFKDSKQDKEPIQLKFITSENKNPQFAEISLPRIGNSSLASFGFQTKARAKTFNADIYAYHKNRLIQHVRFTATVQKDVNVKTPRKQRLKVIFCSRKALLELTNRTEFTSSIQLEIGKNKSSTVHGITNNQPLDLYFADGLKTYYGYEDCNSTSTWR